MSSSSPRRRRASPRCRTPPAAARSARTRPSRSRAPTPAARPGSRGRRASRCRRSRRLCDANSSSTGIGLVVGGDHPVLADDAFERDQLALVVLVRRVGGDVDVAAVVVEDGAILRVGETLARGAVEPECLRDAVRVLLGAAIDVDPEQLPAAQPLRTLAEIIEMLDLVTVEEDRFAQRDRYPPRRPLVRRDVSIGAKPERLSPVRSVRSIPRCGRRVLRHSAAPSPASP